MSSLSRWTLGGTLALVSLFGPAAVAAPPAARGADAHVARGDAAKAARQFDKAIAEYTAALALDPNRMAALKGREWVYNEIGQFDDALTDCNAALAIDPDDVFTLKERVYAWKKLGKNARVVVDCDRILDLTPNDANVLLNRGQAYSDLGFYEKALDDFQAAQDAAGAGTTLGDDAAGRIQATRDRMLDEGIEP